MWTCSATVRPLGWGTLSLRSVYASAMQEEARGQSRSRTFRGYFGSVDSSLVGEIIAAEVHHLVPYGNEVAHEFLLGVVALIDFGERPALSVGTNRVYGDYRR